MIDIKKLQSEANAEISQVSDAKSLAALKVKYLGRKSALNQFMKDLKSLAPEERKVAGQAANELKARIEKSIDEKSAHFGARQEAEAAVAGGLDVTLPGRAIQRGRIHPLIKVMREIIEIFTRMGYSVAEGPEIETDYYNFGALNIPKGHPSRDMWSTLYMSGETLLRTHTSPIQIRVMEKLQPPLKILAPGRVFRRDAADASHSPVFYQVEGLLVDENVTMADLKGTINKFLHEFYGKERKTRFRPSFFPFTESSAEVDVECMVCSGKGCRLCGGSGWLEILGAGMVDPNVFRAVNCDPERYAGFAFGMGVDRIAMLKYGIDDIRLLYENDLRFLRQF